MTNKITDETPGLEEILKRLATSSEDHQAWEYLYRRIRSWILALLYRILRGQRELAEDASQEVFVRLLRYARFEELRQEKAFKKYVYVICQNVGRDYVAGLNALRESHVESVEEQVLNLKDNKQWEREVLLSVRKQEILKTLDDGDRQLMQMIVEGHDLSDVARTLGLSYENAAVRLHRIRKHLGMYPEKKRLL